jgi:AraC family transcriptional activator of pobA
MKKHTHEHLKKLHPMASFGVVSGITNQVRVTKLENRLDPAVPFPHKHNFYHLVYIENGKGWHEIDFIRHVVKSGAFFFMIPAQVHAWSMSKETKGIVIEFENLNMFSSDESYVLNEALRPAQDYLVFSSEAKTEIAELCQSMLNEYEAEKKDFEILLKLNLAKLIILFSRKNIGPLKSITRISKFREEFHELIEKNYKLNHNPEYYAKVMKLNPKSLTAKVKRIIGKNVRDVIQERIVLESKRLLAYSDLSISEIATELGFIDPNYFTRFFKLKTKINPGKFRQKVRHIC